MNGESEGMCKETAVSYTGNHLEGVKHQPVQFGTTSLNTTAFRHYLQENNSCRLEAKT
jgi:hypothetical protein